MTPSARPSAAVAHDTGNMGPRAPLPAGNRSGGAWWFQTFPGGGEVTVAEPPK